EGTADIAVLAVALNDGDLNDVGGKIGLEALFGDGEAGLLAEGEDEAGFDADDGHAVLAGFGLGDKGLGREGFGLHRGEADRLDMVARVEQFWGDAAAGGDDVGDSAVFE